MNGKQIREVLKTSRRGAPAPDESAFWSDFRARARLVVQQEPEAEPSGSWGIPAWTTAAACALLIVVGGWFWMGRVPADSGDLNAVKSLHVSVPYDSVWMVEDSSASATIVWFDRMVIDDVNGNGA